MHYGKNMNKFGFGEGQRSSLLVKHQKAPYLKVGSWMYVILSLWMHYDETISSVVGVQKASGFTLCQY